MPQIKRFAATLIFKDMQKAIVIDLINGKLRKSSNLFVMTGGECTLSMSLKIL